MTTTTKTWREAFLDAVAEFKPIQKSKTNPHFKSKYADLADCFAATTEALHKHGFFVSQSLAIVDSAPALDTELYYVGSDDAVMWSKFLLAAEPNPQKMGSQIMYARRYSYCALLGLVAEDDDDGNAAARSSNGRKAAKKTDPPGQEENKALTYVRDYLNGFWGGTEPFDPKEKLSVIKDLTGSGDWKAFLAAGEEVHKHVCRKVGSRRAVVIVCDLVKAGIRRPDRVIPEAWPTDEAIDLLSSRAAEEAKTGAAATDQSDIPF